MKKKIFWIFFDDGVAVGRTWAEALDNLGQVLEIAARFRLIINWNKCQLMQTRIDFLGYVVEDGMIRPSPEKSTAVANYPEPRTIKQLQRFLGLASYLRKSLKDSPYSPNHSDMLKKSIKFKMGEDQQAAFVKLKRALVQAPVVQLYHQDGETELHTDASKHGYGVILLQRHPDDQKLHPVYFLSRKTTDDEAKYNSYELEFLAVVRALEKFRNYLLGLQFKVVTDCATFRTTMAKKELTPQVGRWAMIVEEFECQIEHRSGTRMRHVDALSRVLSINIAEGTFIGRLKRAIERDEKIATIKALLQKEPFQDYVIEIQIEGRKGATCCVQRTSTRNHQKSAQSWAFRREENVRAARAPILDRQNGAPSRAGHQKLSAVYTGIAESRESGRTAQPDSQGRFTTTHDPYGSRRVAGVDQERIQALNCNDRRVYEVHLDSCDEVHRNSRSAQEI